MTSESCQYPFKKQLKDQHQDDRARRNISLIYGADLGVPAAPPPSLSVCLSFLFFLTRTQFHALNGKKKKELT